MTIDPHTPLANQNITTDLSNILIYVNDLTNGLAMPVVLVSFFFVAFLGGAFAQMRFRGAMRIDFSFAVASFVTFGFAVLMSMKNGLINPLYLFITLAMSILGAIWLYFSQE